MGASNSSVSRSLEGKTALVTGANTGLGYQTALQLSQQGATVVLACRNRERGEAALAEMQKENPTGKFELQLLDLGSLKDVERFATEFNGGGKDVRRLDILVNNAGLRSDTYQTTVDGFESQIATNYLGHFALTGQLMPSLLKAPTPRVVSVGSLRARQAKRPELEEGVRWSRSTAHLIAVDFVKSAATFNADDCYSESKCASLMFMRQLGVRHPRVLSVGGHPGGSATNIIGENEYKMVRWAFQSPKMGSLPILKAATDPFITNGTYFGPLYGFRGRPALAWLPSLAKDDEICKAYWEASVKATGVKF